MTDREIWVRFAAASMAGLSGRDDLTVTEAADGAAQDADALLAEYRKRYAPERDEETALRQWREGQAFGHVSHADEQQLDDAAPKPCATCGGRGVVKRKSCACWPCPDCAGENGGGRG